MTRLPKLIAVLLAHALCASGGVASLAATCTHMAGTPATPAHARHDCCHAAHAHTNAHAGATHKDDCAAWHERNSAQVASVGDDGSPCAGCCAERAAVQPRALATSSAQKLNRPAEARAARVPPAFAAPAPLHTAFAPTQHAPPHASARLHMLIGVLLI
jgi:hypothetical protein